MSLLTQAMEPVILLEKKRQPDGEGGFLPAVWVEGAEFKAAISYDNSLESRVAEKDGVTSLYTITTSKNANLQYHDVLKRVRDGKIFRVTSDGDDNVTPASATFQFCQVSAEEWQPA